MQRVKTELEADSVPKTYHRSKQLDAYLEQIKAYLEQDLSGVLIHRRLLQKYGLQISYSSVSRYAYYELVTDQSVATFIRCHLHAFEFFGGAPQWVLLDYLKAGVIQPQLF